MCPGDRNWRRLLINVHWSHESERECRELEEGLRQNIRHIQNQQRRGTWERRLRRSSPQRQEENQRVVTLAHSEERYS